MAWFHCFAGIAGDMALGSLLDAGADLAEVLALLERLPLGGWALEAEPVLRGGIAATRAVVSAEDSVVVRTHAHIVGLIGEARLPERVTRRALATFAALADVEGRLHRRPVDQVHFHEVGWPRHHHGRGRARQPPSRSSASTRCRPARWPPGSGWSGPPTGCCPTPPRRWWRCWPGCPPGAATSRWS